MPANRPFSLLIKPAGADCNLRCGYCFYRDRASLYPETTRHRMPEEVLTRVISSYLATDQLQYAFGWQGGEPTLMGTEFFRRVTDLQQRHGRPGSLVANGLQTNALLLDDGFCAHLAKYNFLVGVSLDGPAEIHDTYRRTADGRGTHALVLQSLEALRRRKAEFNILTLVTAANAGRGGEVYRYLRDRGFLYHQYIPCVESGENGLPLPCAVDGEAWGEFLIAVFDEWSKSDARRVSVRLFDSILAYLAGGRHNVCHMGGDCRQYFVVEYNGDVYPCDFFVRPGLKLGNIMEDDWDYFLASPVRAAFSLAKTDWPQACRGCEYLAFCSADCQKHRLGGPGSVSALCAGWRAFYAHALPCLTELARSIKKSGALGPPVPGRNDPCFCGSGRKFKKCHGSF